MAMIAGGFGLNGGQQRHGGQTRHTFSNIVFLKQTSATAQTLHYNIVERYFRGVAIDGSSFLYRLDWIKTSGLWKSTGARCLVFGHDRMGTNPAPDTMSTYLNMINSWQPPPLQSCNGHASFHSGETITGHTSSYTRLNDGSCCNHSSGHDDHCGFEEHGASCIHFVGINCTVTTSSRRHSEGASSVPDSTHIKLPSSPSSLLPSSSPSSFP